MRAVKNLFYTLQANFNTIGHNGKIILYCQPIWAIANALYSPYVTQYMLAMGCSKAQVGIINAIGMATGAVLGLFAGWVTDRLGRRLTTAVADSITWGVTCVLWVLASNWLWFVAAAVTNSFMRLNQVSWNCLLTEDTQPRNRLNIFWWMSIANTSAIFFTPLMTPLIHRWGLPTAMRWVLMVTTVIYMIIYVVRYLVTRETDISRERREAARHTSPWAGLRVYGPVILRVIKNPVVLTFLLIRALYNVQFTIRGNFLSIAVVQGMGFGDSILGTINLITGVVMLAAQFILMPKLSITSPVKPLMASLVTLLVAHLLLIVAPAHSMVSVLLFVVALSVGAVIAGMLIETLMANAMPNEDRAGILALTSVIIVAVSAPFQLLAGFLAELPGVGPRLPMGIIAAIFIACMGLLWDYARKTRNAVPQED